MTGTQIAAYIFTGLIVIFFMIAYFVKPASEEQSSKILRFLAAVCSGFAAGFWVGTALLNIEGMVGGVKVTLSATAGFAMAIIVWLSWDRTIQPQKNTKFNFSTDIESTFEDLVRSLVATKLGSVGFENFSSDELASKIAPVKLSGGSLEDVLRLLPSRFPKIPAYDILGELPMLILRKR